METTFDFTTTDNKYFYNMNSTNILLIKRINHSVAVLYFMDEMNNKIDIPDNIVIYTYDYQTNKKIILNAIRQAYLLCWTDDYIVEFDKIELIKINNQRKWNIIS